DRRAQVDVRRTNHNLVTRVASHERQKIAEVVTSLAGVFVHLPVGSHHFFAGHEVLSRESLLTAKCAKVTQRTQGRASNRSFASLKTTPTLADGRMRIGIIVCPSALRRLAVSYLRETPAMHHHRWRCA